MLRKALGTGLVFAASAVNAGLYVGAGIGSDTVDFKQSSHIYQLSNFNVINKAHFSGTGVFGTLFAGYSWLRDQFYLAGELNADVSSTTAKSYNRELLHASVSGTRYNMENNFGVSVLPGYQFSPATLFYGRLGYENARFKIDTSDASIGSTHNRRGGFRYGLGVKQAISEHVALRLDYSRVNYGSTQRNTLDRLSSTYKTTTIRPIQQLVEFGIIYSFDGGTKDK